MAVRSPGHSAEVAENGAVALQMLRHGAFDAVLLDIVMPEVEGYEVLQGPWMYQFLNNADARTG